MSLQQTITTEAAGVAEVAGQQSLTPTVIVDPTGGATVDAESRTAIIAILDLLRSQKITSAT